jgi:TonB family protein
LWWFQPLAWILQRKLRIESELACDAAALNSGLRPSCYAAELVAVARSLRPSDRPLFSCGINMARGSNLEHRIEMILRPRILTTPMAARIAVASLLPALAVAASALTPGSDESSNTQGGSIMKRTLMSGLLTSIGLSAATVTGSVHDANGSAIANATVTIVNPDTGANQATATDAEGKFNLSGASAGQYILKIEKAGFMPVLREFDLKADTDMARQVTMSPEGAQSGPDDQVTESQNATKPVSIGGRVAQSNLLKKVQPIYPSAAKAAGTQGTVQIKATISKDGVPVDLEVVSAPSGDLAESALQAVRQWRYRPTLLNGEPVEVTTTVIVNYTLAS